MRLKNNRADPLAHIGENLFVLNALLLMILKSEKSKIKSSSNPSECKIKGIEIVDKTNSNPSKCSPSRTGKKGCIYIFNHRSFENPDLIEREGTEKDYELLQETFTELQFEVNPFHDLNIEQIEEKVKEIKKKDFKEYSCLVITILTHGDIKEILYAKNDIYELNDILFPILENPTLINLPKIFITQACRGKIDLRMCDCKKPYQVIAQTDILKIQNIKEKIIVPKPLTEILKLYSTCEGSVAFLEKTGSIFIKTLCKYLKMYGNSKSISAIFKLVGNEVKKNTRNKQIPITLSTLTDSICLGGYDLSPGN